MRLIRGLGKTSRETQVPNDSLLFANTHVMVTSTQRENKQLHAIVTNSVFPKLHFKAENRKLSVGTGL